MYAELIFFFRFYFAFYSSYFFIIIFRNIPKQQQQHQHRQWQLIWWHLLYIHTCVVLRVTAHSQMPFSMPLQRPSEWIKFVCVQSLDLLHYSIKNNFLSALAEFDSLTFPFYVRCGAVKSDIISSSTYTVIWLSCGGLILGCIYSSWYDIETNNQK